MLALKIVLLTLHIATAAMIFGAPLGTIGSLRRALAGGDAAVLRGAAIDATRRGLMSQLGAIGALLTGLALVFLAGGFGVVRPPIHASLALLLLALGFSFGWMKPNGMKLVAAASANPPNKETFAAAAKKLAVGTGILHLIWLVILVLMVWN